MTEVKNVIRTLQSRQPVQSLRPKQVWDERLSSAIDELPLDGAAPNEASALRSALHLWNDDLDRSHEISQQLHTSTGSLLHGIMHRMEGDHDNADYWFRRVGTHACYATIAKNESGWDPFRFNRAVEDAVETSSDERDELERIQKFEMETVVSYCLQQCFGGKEIGWTEG